MSRQERREINSHLRILQNQKGNIRHKIPPETIDPLEDKTSQILKRPLKRREVLALGLFAGTVAGFSTAKYLPRKLSPEVLVPDRNFDIIYFGTVSFDPQSITQITTDIEDSIFQQYVKMSQVREIEGTHIDPTTKSITIQYPKVKFEHHKGEAPQEHLQLHSVVFRDGPEILGVNTGTPDNGDLYYTGDFTFTPQSEDPFVEKKDILEKEEDLYIVSLPEGSIAIRPNLVSVADPELE